MPQGRTVASVGLGAMGAPIAQHLVAAGFTVLTFDADPEARVPGAQAVGSLAGLAAAEVVVVVVPTDDDVRSVLTAPGGLFDVLAPGAVVVLSSSLHPDTCRELADHGASFGIDVVDAALTGGVRGAEAGTLNLLVGGPQSVVDRVTDVFAAFADGWHVLGAVGAGQVAKTANNLIHWAQVVSIDESLRLAGRYGVSPARLRAALQDGPTDSRGLRELELMRFTWYAKDLAIAEQLAAAVDMPLPQATLSRRLMESVTAESVHDLLADDGRNGR